MFVTFDVKRVRAAYPALSDGFAYLDGAAVAAASVPARGAGGPGGPHPAPPGAWEILLRASGRAPR